MPTFACGLCGEAHKGRRWWGSAPPPVTGSGGKCLATPRASRSDTKVRGVAGAAAGQEVSPDGRRAGLTDTNDPSRPFQWSATPPGNPAIEAPAGLLLRAPRPRKSLGNCYARATCDAWI